MTTTAPTRPPAAVAAVTESLVDLIHSFQRAKARVMSDPDDVEWSSQVLLRHLAHDGPMRAGTLAESLQLDPSTVSRQVAALVRAELLERRSDPEDGRASLLVLTDRAHVVIAEHEQRRLELFAGMLADWSAADLDRFGTLFARFVADFDRVASRWTPASHDTAHTADHRPHDHAPAAAPAASERTAR